MSRILGAALVATALVATPAAAKTPKACRHLHGHAKKACVRKHVKPKPKKDVLPLRHPGH